MENTFKVTYISYEMYEVDNESKIRNLLKKEYVYPSIEVFKSETKEITESMVKSLGGTVCIEIQIEKNGEYYDGDTGWLNIKQDKISVLKEPFFIKWEF